MTDSSQLTQQNRYWKADLTYHVFGGELTDKNDKPPPILFPSIRGRQQKYRKIT